jgi:hypothetical protein
MKTVITLVETDFGIDCEIDSEEDGSLTDVVAEAMWEWAGEDFLEHYDPEDLH